MYNFLMFKMEENDKKVFNKYLESYFNKLPKKLVDSKEKMFAYYDYEVDINQKDDKNQ